MSFWKFDCLFPPILSAGVEGMQHHIDFYVQFKDPNSSLYVFMAG